MDSPPHKSPDLGHEDGDDDDDDEDGGNDDDSEQMKKNTTNNCFENDVGDTYAYPKLFYDLEPLVLHSLFFPQDIARPRSAVPDQQIIIENNYYRSFSTTLKFPPMMFFLFLLRPFPVLSLSRRSILLLRNDNFRS